MDFNEISQSDVTELQAAVRRLQALARAVLSTSAYNAGIAPIP